MMKTETENETYGITVRCKNCNYGFGSPRHLEIKKGVTVRHRLTWEECPKCGCTTLIQID